MPSVRDFLERLRPSGTPGAASVSGVPADRVTERVAELESVFDQLVDVQADAERIRSQGSIEAQQRRDVAAATARSIVAEARRLSESERAAAAATAHAEARAAARAIITGARAEADAITRAAEDRLPAMVAAVRQEAHQRLVAELADAS